MGLKSPQRTRGTEMASIKCTNGSQHTHASVAESRACWGASLQAQDDRAEVFAANVRDEELAATLVPAESLAEINRDQETWPWTHRKGNDPHPMDLGRRYVETLHETGLKPDESVDAQTVVFSNGQALGTSDTTSQEVWEEFTATERYRPAARPAVRSNERGATDPMKNFVRILLAERDRTQLTDEALRAESIRADVTDCQELSFSGARRLIEGLKLLPKKAAEQPKGQKEQPWKTLSRKVPAGYYATTDAEGKNHFYRVSVGRNDFYKIQEQASSDLFFIPLNRYAGILEAILDVGVVPARKAYADLQGRCGRCNRVLTDNTNNPYFGVGMGPDCGGRE